MAEPCQCPMHRAEREARETLEQVTCERDEALARAEAAEEALAKINVIRNSIVGTQTLNWSEHVYPLVAALNEAGVKGLPYPEAKASVGTLIEQRDALREALEDLFSCLALIGGSKELVALLGDAACSALDRLAALAQAKGGSK